MRALVTGASGFIGQVLCKQLGERGHEVTALVRRPGSEPAGTNAVLGDLRVEDGLPQALASWRPDCGFHLAAEIPSQRSEGKVRKVNVPGPRRIGDAVLAP